MSTPSSDPEIPERIAELQKIVELEKIAELDKKATLLSDRRRLLGAPTPEAEKPTKNQETNFNSFDLLKDIPF